MTDDRIRDFRDLRVWQDAISLVEEVYKASASFPREELYGVVSQMRTAAVSIPSNIAEGQSREHLTEYLHFLSIAIGSSAELQTQVIIAERLGFLRSDGVSQLQERIESVRRQARALKSAPERKRSQPPHP